MINYSKLEWEHVLQQIKSKGEQNFKNFQHSLKSSSCGLCVCARRLGGAINYSLMVMFVEGYAILVD
jgi:hypothetical protein